MPKSARIRLFISHRHADEAEPSLPVRELVQILQPHYDLFFDAEHINNGDEYFKRIADEVKSRDVLLAVIGSKWLTILHEKLITDSTDYVTFELKTAFESGVPVLPVLLPGAVMPGNARLPNCIRPLTDVDAVHLLPLTDSNASLPVEKLREGLTRRAFAKTQGRKEGEMLPNLQGMNMVWCPANSFLMGSPGKEPDRNADEERRQVHLSKGFWIASTPVTQGQWQALMERNPSHFKNPDAPVESIDWFAATTFCTHLTSREKPMGRGCYALPTEAQWEYACRAGTSTAFAFGKALSSSQAAIQMEATKRVGSFRSNAWGLYDMHGNVREWCQDWYGRYSGAESLVDPAGPATGEFKVLRGGCYLSSPAQCRSARRVRTDPALAHGTNGLRPVLNPEG